MYCIQCGVKLADTEKKCPLCGTVPYHPDIPREPADNFYPPERYPQFQINRKSILGTVSILYLLPALITLVCDLQLSGTVSWSGYVLGALILAYVVLVLPAWFHKVEAAYFVLADFAVAAVYVGYICHVTQGSWYFSFALPVIVFMGTLFILLAVLLRRLVRGKLAVIGGALIAVGIFMPAMEQLLVVSFSSLSYMGWSLYPLVSMLVLGGVLIFLAVYRPARHTMERKFFL